MPSAKTSPLKLHALGGKETPAQLVADARSAIKLTDGAVKNIWTVLDPCLTQPMTPELGKLISQFCLQYEVAEADFGRGIRATRTLFRKAAALDLPLSELTADVSALFGDNPHLCESLIARYESTKTRLRSVLFMNTLRAHGAVLEDVDWRLDYVAATTDAPRLQMPVALLTLRYSDHGAERHLTLQVPGDKLEKLKLICAALTES